MADEAQKSAPKFKYGPGEFLFVPDPSGVEWAEPAHNRVLDAKTIACFAEYILERRTFLGKDYFGYMRSPVPGTQIVMTPDVRKRKKLNIPYFYGVLEHKVFDPDHDFDDDHRLRNWYYGDSSMVPDNWGGVRSPVDTGYAYTCHSGTAEDCHDQELGYLLKDNAMEITTDDFDTTKKALVMWENIEKACSASSDDVESILIFPGYTIEGGFTAKRLTTDGDDILTACSGGTWDTIYECPDGEGGTEETRETNYCCRADVVTPEYETFITQSYERHYDMFEETESCSKYETEGDCKITEEAHTCHWENLWNDTTTNSGSETVYLYIGPVCHSHLECDTKSEQDPTLLGDMVSDVFLRLKVTALVEEPWGDNTYVYDDAYTGVKLPIENYEIVIKDDYYCIKITVTTGMLESATDSLPDKMTTKLDPNYRLDGQHCTFDRTSHYERLGVAIEGGGFTYTPRQVIDNG